MARKKVDWAAYDKSLKQRGDITFWISDEAIKAWNAEPSRKPGGQSKFSDLAIETALTLRLVFKQGLRQTEGFIGSVFNMMKLDLDVPDHSTLSRRGKIIDLPSVVGKNSNQGLVIIIDSTGLKIYGAGEWNESKHGLKKRKEWRKLHLGIDESTLEIIVSSLTNNRVGDPTEAVNLLEQVQNPIDEFLGDGAYDSKKVVQVIENRNENGCHHITVPPKKDAILSSTFLESPTQRDKHVGFIKKHGRRSWESKVKYYRRLLVENTMGRFKGIIGTKLRSRDFDAQGIEMKLGCKILNMMVKLGTPLHPVKKIS